MIQEVFSQNEGKFSVYFIIALTETRVMKFLIDRICSKILLCGLSFGFVLFGLEHFLNGSFLGWLICVVSRFGFPHFWIGSILVWLNFGLAHFWFGSFLVWLNLSWPIFGLSLFTVFPDISKRFDEID